MPLICIEQQNIDFYPSGEYAWSPDEAYPEYRGSFVSEAPNPVYAMIRDGFRRLGMDGGNFGRPEWNPLGEVIKPGNTVLLKPNLVMHENPGGLDCLVTHPSVIRAVLDYVLIALKGSGKVIIGDAPVQSCDFEKLLEDGGYRGLEHYYGEQGIPVSFLDFRHTVTRRRPDGVLVEEKDREGVVGGKVVGLGEKSAFSSLAPEGLKKLRITNYPPEKLIAHHNASCHEYLVSDALLSADVVINLPKPKTHRKAGITGAMKNMVGVNADKAYLPHHRTGALAEGGDEYRDVSRIKAARTLLQEAVDRADADGKYRKASALLKFSSLLYQVQKLTGAGGDRFSEGSWYGNDTAWRMISDLQKIVFFADREGKLRDTPQRKMFIVADMIVSGEGEGPLLPTPKPFGAVILGGDAPLADLLVADLFGIDADRIPSLVHLREREKERETEVVSNRPEYDGKLLSGIPAAGHPVKLPSGWTEIAENSGESAGMGADEGKGLRR